METKSNLVNYLALQAVQTPYAGLYHGRMGIILSLYCHGVVVCNKHICDYASDILQLTDEDYFDNDITLENGLCGLGLGYTLLYKAGMFRDDLNEILFDIDHRIMDIDPRRMSDYSFKKGALGIIFYIKTRLSLGQVCESIHNDYIQELERNIQEHTSQNVSESHFLLSFQRPNWKEEDYVGKDAGIDNGSSYFLIRNSYDKIFSRK